jgi:hypothetical protein
MYLKFHYTFARVRTLLVSSGGLPSVKHRIWIIGTKRQCVEANNLDYNDHGVLKRLKII